jgi:hypothetical protein
MNPESRICQNCKNPFVIESEDFAFYEKIEVPPPTWCWRCRAMRRMSFRNFRFIYPRICAGTGKKIFSSLPPDAPMPPYDKEYWLSDNWDAMEYGKEYDFSRPFFEQMKELYHTVPWAPMWQHNTVNSDYGVAIDAKNCYLCFDAGFIEDSAYGVTLQHSRQCFDTINCKHCELCYFLINGSNCYKTFFSRNCDSCSEVWFSSDCTGCDNCFGCAGLRNKNYYIFNEPHTKETYKKNLEKLKLHSWVGLQAAYKIAQAAWLKHPVKYQHSFQAAGCTGDYLYHATELRNCFFAEGPQNCAHSQSIVYTPIRDSMDVTSSGIGIELDYEISDAGDTMYKVFFADSCATVSESQYVINCKQSSNLFGCVAIRSKQYCILNKQYSKEEYERLIPKIIEHMNAMPYVDAKNRVYKYGEFFPLDMSPIGYNESQAYEYFPIPEEEARGMGFKWKIPEKRNYDITKKTKDLPNSINDVSDDVVNDVIQCEHDEAGNHPFQCEANCPTAFRITSQELQFYKQMELSLPRACFNCRHSQRASWRNLPQLYKRSCICLSQDVYTNAVTHFHGSTPCPNAFETSYAPERPEIVYCEQCYQAEVA